MRSAAIIALGVLGIAACGGGESTPPAKSEADTSSLEASGSSAKDKESSDEAPSAASSSAPAATPAPAPAASAAADTSAPAAAFHPAPSVTGTIDGKAFTPKVAQVLAPMKKDGRIAINLTESSECPAAGDAKSDHTTLTVIVPWSDGYKVDLAALKLGGKKGPGEITLSHGKKDVSTTFKPSGTVTVVSAPSDKNATGKLKIDLQSGDYMLAGTLDIEMCAAAK
jgi:hypothetical protein